MSLTVQRLSWLAERIGSGRDGSAPHQPRGHRSAGREAGCIAVGGSPIARSESSSCFRPASGRTDV